MTEPKTKPEIGMGATLCYPSDRYPLLITSVSPSGKKITVKRVSSDGLTPDGRCNGFPVFDHEYSAEELKAGAYGEDKPAYLRKNGHYYLSGSPVVVGGARYFRNYAD